MHGKLLIIIAIALTAMSVGAVAPSVDSLLAHYRKAETTADSLQRLYNVFDVSRYQSKVQVGRKLFELADRLGNDSITMAVLRDITERDDPGDSVLARYISRVEAMPPSADRDQTLVILRVRQLVSRERVINSAERRDMLQQLLTNLQSNRNQNVYNRIENMLGICILLGLDTQSDLLTDYYDRLEHDVHLLKPDENRQLISVCYRRADEAYTINNQPAMAVAAGKNLLAIQHDIEEATRRCGRPYANFDSRYYEAYRRLLNNFRALDNDEIKEYHDSIRAIVHRDIESYDDYRTNERAEIYYLVAMHRYREAIDALRRQVDQPYNLPYRRILLKLMIESAQAIGDKDALLESSLAYSNLLEERLRNKTGERARELEIIYNVAALDSENARLLLDKQHSQVRNTRNGLIFAAILLVLLIVTVVIMSRQYRTSRALTSELNLSNEMLRGERDNLKHVLDELTKARDHAENAERKKTEFINNIIHEVMTPLSGVSEYSRLIVDCLDEDKRRYMSHYADLINLNVELLHAIVSDLQDMSDADNSRIVVRFKPVSVNEVCTLAVDGMKVRVAPGVTMTYAKAGSPDVTIISDSVRVSQVLNNLLSNAAKFTEQGSIVLDYTIDQHAQKITFSVTDTGIGIPTGKEKHIFQRFVKLNKYSQGQGLGLAICRLMARLLRGSVVVDTDYHRGARFLFTIPMHPSVNRKPFDGVKK